MEIYIYKTNFWHSVTLCQNISNKFLAQSHRMPKFSFVWSVPQCFDKHCVFFSATVLQRPPQLQMYFLCQAVASRDNSIVQWKITFFKGLQNYRLLLTFKSLFIKVFFKKNKNTKFPETIKTFTMLKIFFLRKSVFASVVNETRILRRLTICVAF